MTHAGRDGQLYEALRTFGRQERQLTAANLEHQEDILVALFGEAVMRDGSDRRHAAQRTEQAMLQVIESITDRAQRRAAEVLFASKPEFHGLYVKERIAVVEGNDQDRAFLSSQYKRLRDGALEHMTTTLRHVLAAIDAEAAKTVTSPVALRAARQLYRYVQPTLIVLEAHHDCVRFESQMQSRCWSGHSHEYLEHHNHGWLQQYGKPGVDFRIVRTDWSLKSELSLWTFAYYHRYRRALLQEPTGRDLLRENLETRDWVYVQKGSPFPEGDIDILVSALGASEIDEASYYIAALIEDDAGRAVYEKWMDLLTTDVYERDQLEQRERWQPTEADRQRLIGVLLALCIALQDAFPNETLIDPEEDYMESVSWIIWQGLHASGAVEGADDVDREDALADDIACRRPPRYMERPEGEPTWSHAGPYPDLWA